MQGISSKLIFEEIKWEINNRSKGLKCHKNIIIIHKSKIFKLYRWEKKKKEEKGEKGMEKQKEKRKKAEKGIKGNKKGRKRNE